MKNTVKLAGFNGVAAGATATINLPIGRRYHEIALLYATLADLEEIRVKANGKTIMVMTAAQLDTINQYDGLAAASTSGILSLNFDRPNLSTKPGRETTALNTGVADKNGQAITSLSLEVDIASGATSPTLSGYAIVSDAIEGSNGAGDVLHREKITLPVAATGDVVLDSLPLNSISHMFISRINFFEASDGQITNFKIDRDYREIFNRTSALNDKIQTDAGYKTIQGSYGAIDTTEKGDGAELIQVMGAQDFRVTLTAGATGNISILVDWIGKLGD